MGKTKTKINPKTLKKISLKPRIKSRIMDLSIRLRSRVCLSLRK